MFARAAAANGLDVVAIAIKKDASAWLPRLVQKTYWLSLQDFGKMFSIFKREGISKVIMAGQVNPRSLFYKDLGDTDLKKLLAAARDKRPETVFGAVGNMLAEHGIELVDSTIFLEKFLPQEGVLTRIVPDARTWEDIRFGFEMAKKVALLDIGQTLVVRDKAIVAVEAIEGTDAAIRRGGKVAGGGITVVKVSKADQDMRFDIPVVGPRTVKNLICVKGRCLAIEADKTLMIDRELCVKMAERHLIAIVAL